MFPNVLSRLHVQRAAIAVVLAIAVWIINRGSLTTNWEGRYQFKASTTLKPSSVEEISNAVIQAGKTGKTIKVVGAGHSWSNIAVPEEDGIMMTLEEYSGIVRIDVEKNQITVKGGTLLSEISDALERDGMAMSVIPSVSSGTIAGTIATGTHSTGNHHGIIASYVVRLQIVSGTGKVYEASRDHNPDIFNASLVSLGMLGVITEVTLQCEPAYYLNEVVTVEPMDDIIDNLDEVMASADHVKLWLEVNAGLVQVHRMHRTQEPPRNQPSRLYFTLKLKVCEVFIYLASWFPSTCSSIVKFLTGIGEYLPTRNQIDIPLRVFNIPHELPKHPETEYSVPIPQAKDKVRKFLQLVEQYKGRMAFTLASEIRFVKGDNIWMSLANGRDSAFLTFLTYNPGNETFWQFANDLRRLWSNDGGRPHWGKILTENEETLRSKYPHWDEFMTIHKEMDPKQIFRNAYLRRMFPSVFTKGNKE